MTRAERREFDSAMRMEILTRATDSSGRFHCEGCGKWLASWLDGEVDHIISEGVRPDEDKKRPLTAADGQFICFDCHRKKTRDDTNHLARAKRREKKTTRPVAVGEPGMARRFREDA